MKSLNEVWGGGGISSRRCYVLVLKFIGGYYVHVAEFIGGMMSTLKNPWGDYVHVYKFEQGGILSGRDIVCIPYSSLER